MSDTRSLLLASSFPPAVGGMETLLFQTARRLSPPPLVVAPAPALAAGLEVAGVNASPRGLAGRAAYRAVWAVHPSLYYLAAFWRAGLSAARRHRPRVIQCGHVYLAPLGWLLGRRFGTPYVVYAFGQEVWWSGRRMGLRSVDEVLRGRALAGADAVLVPGTFTAGLVREWGVVPKRITMVPFGADPRPPTPPPSGATLLSVCRLVPRKGVDTVIRALPAIARALPSVTFHVVGSGPDEARLRDLAASHHVSNRVRFLGRLGDRDLAREYRDAALFVLPSHRTPDGQLEGLGLVYLEAAAWGRPSLAGRSGGEVDAVVDGVTGRLVDGSSPETVAARVVDLLAHPDLLARMGAAARQRVETTHNWDRAAAVVQDVLERVAGRG